MQVIKGFTLIELITALLVAAILIAVSTPSFLSLVKNTRLDSTASVLSSDLARARSEAIRRGRVVNACATDGIDPGSGNCGDGDWANGWTVYEDSDENSALNAGDDVIVENTSESESTVRFIDTSDNPVSIISFSSRGTPSISGVFHICDDRVEINRTLLLSLGGRVSVSENSASCE